MDKLTVATIADSQIEALSAEARSARDWELHEACEQALTLAPGFDRFARQKCVDAINAARAMEDENG
jgi:hypothetical protein